MLKLVNNYYKSLGEIEKEVIFYLDSCIEILNKNNEISNEIIIDVLCIKKINENLHRSSRIHFLCEIFENTLFNIKVKEGALEISEKENVNTKLENAMFVDGFK